MENKEELKCNGDKSCLFGCVNCVTAIKTMKKETRIDSVWVDTKKWSCPCGNKAQEFEFCSKKCEKDYSAKDPITQDWKEGFMDKFCYEIERSGMSDDRIEEMFAFIEKVRTEALEEQKEKIFKMIEEEWTPKKTYKDYGINRISMTLDDHKRNFANEVITKIKQTI